VFIIYGSVQAEEWSKNAGGEDINKPDERLVRAIVDQVQYYLSADNLDTDGFLNELLVYIYIYICNG
jgi:hypothetical protein